MNERFGVDDDVGAVLQQDRPCTWALRRYGLTLDTTILSQRMALIDDMIVQLRGTIGSALDIGREDD